MNFQSLPKRAFRKLVCVFLRKKTVLHKGVELDVDYKELNKINPNYGDWFIHPCVRYIPESFAGHQWWMVVTPYPKANSKYENPVLYYGEGETEEPPKNWHMVAVVQDTHPEGGYNADGNIYYDGEKLWIIWKENDTNNVRKENGNRVIMGCSYDGKSFSAPQVFAHNPDDKSMYLAAPVLCKMGDYIKMLGVYSPVMGDNEQGKEKKPRSIAVFGLKNSDFSNLPFDFEKIAEQEYYKGFDFWHIDCFEGNGKYYCLVTPESGNEILLGESENGLNFRFFDTPLLHANGRDRVRYMYKPSGVLIGNQFHLFYPSKLKNTDRVHIFCTTVRFDELLSALNDL